MNRGEIARRLIGELEKFTIVDCHEHLPPESVRVGMKADALTLFSHYTRCDLMAAGLSQQDYDRSQNPDLPLDLRWKIVSPYIPFIRYGSYARPAFIAAKEFYGFDDISDKTYEGLSAKMAQANTPGIYRRVLRDKCHIRVSLTQAGRTDYDGDLLIPLMPLDTYTNINSWDTALRLSTALQMKVASLDDWLAVMEAGLVKWKGEGVVGLKMTSRALGPPKRAEAVALFDRLRSGAEAGLAYPNPLYEYLLDKMLDIVAAHDMVVAVHAGMWGDFRLIDAQHMIPVVQRHPKTRFDLYHMGMPQVRETAIIAKNWPNVWLNLCWTHIISQKQTCNALDEYLDIVPVNKILAFGGDYGKPVEKVYGHLVMAREDIAHVLAGRVAEGLMTEDQALEVARLWFWENPKTLYRLKI